MSYAHVRFVDDKIYFTFNIKDIKGQNLTGEIKYRKDYLYKVRWSDGYYYNAQIAFIIVWL